MAGDWIKLQHVTPDKPEVHQIAARLNIKPEQVVGHLVRVWIWVDQQSLDGHALSVTNVTLDAIARCDDFASAMREAGWLTGDSGSLSFPNFDRHNGQSAKKRALAADRQQHRRGSMSRSQRDETVTREEKRRSNKPVPFGTEAGRPPPKDSLFWETGVELLEISGIPEKQARAVIGKHVKTDREKLAVVLVQMAAQRPVDPLSYLQKAMQPQPLKVAL